MNKDAKKRLFVATNLPSTIKMELASLAEPAPHIKWMNPQQFHITVYFLGNTPEEQIAQIKDIIKKAVADLPAITIKLSGVKVVKRRMIWVEVSDVNNLLNTLHQRLKKEFINKKIGERGVERAYRPHILLGKYTGGEVLLGDDAVAAKAKSIFRITPLELDTVSLYESILKPEGAVHLELAEFRCGKSPQIEWQPAGKGEV